MTSPKRREGPAGRRGRSTFSGHRQAGGTDGWMATGSGGRDELERTARFYPERTTMSTCDVQRGMVPHFIYFLSTLSLSFFGRDVPTRGNLPPPELRDRATWAASSPFAQLPLIMRE
ncbi:hypothetical protein NL676_036402 [Syzygium grande]|nr:hypothetical protein NL676_036402 [Syzygium grande]